MIKNGNVKRTRNKMETVENEKCVFCKIVSGKDEKTNILHSDDTVVVFRDIKPATPHHYLVVTKEHIPDAKKLIPSQDVLVEKMVDVGNDILQKQNADIGDVRMGFHWPPFHLISHLHLHVISSTSQMGWISRGIFKENSYWFVTANWVIQRLKNMQKKISDAQL